jgi:excisionase family DNA binding protein
VNPAASSSSCTSTEKLLPRGGEFLRVSEAASHLNISEKTVRRLIAAGTVKTLRIGRLVRIPREEIERFVAAVSFSADTPKGAR